MNKSDNPYHSKPLDVHRTSEHPEVKQLLDQVWSEFSAEQLDRVVKKGNRKPLADARKQLQTLLLDLYVTWLLDPTLWTGSIAAPMPTHPNGGTTNCTYQRP